MAGFFSPTTRFGDTMLSVAPGDMFDIFVTKIRPSDGSPVWAVQLGGLGPDKYPYVAVDAAGRPVKIAPVIPETEVEKRRFAAAQLRRQRRLEERNQERD